MNVFDNVAYPLRLSPLTRAAAKKRCDDETGSCRAEAARQKLMPELPVDGASRRAGARYRLNRSSSCSMSRLPAVTRLPWAFCRS
ncbi:hypothetical protein KCP77_04835 [Salmonella enterica subsp. enterica]|nr:hypothetical protein KCP77_04835 [Salmonella enterica subsp. enterica]